MKKLFEKLAMKKVLDTLVGLLLCVSSTAVTAVAIVYLVGQAPFAHKSDVATVQKTASDAAIEAQGAQAQAAAASAEVSTAVEKHTKKLKTDAERIGKNQADLAELFKRMGELRTGETIEQGEIDSIRKGRAR